MMNALQVIPGTLRLQPTPLSMRSPVVKLLPLSALLMVILLQSVEFTAKITRLTPMKVYMLFRTSLLWIKDATCAAALMLLVWRRRILHLLCMVSTLSNVKPSL